MNSINKLARIARFARKAVNDASKLQSLLEEATGCDVNSLPISEPVNALLEKRTDTIYALAVEGTDRDLPQSDIEDTTEFRDEIDFRIGNVPDLDEVDRTPADCLVNVNGQYVANPRRVR